MRVKIFLFAMLITAVVKSQDCEDLSIEQEVYMTENIALVKSHKVIGDSVELEVIKKWKGDSIPQFFKMKQAALLSKHFRLDSNKTYLLFWYHNLAIERCSRTAEFKYSHFEYKLDELFKSFTVVNVTQYDSILYKKRNVFSTVSGAEFDQKKGVYAFYDIASGEVKSFSELPKEVSYFYPRRFYIIDKQVKTATKTYDIVFAVSNTHDAPEITNELKKAALKGLFKN